jgi:hypothetical protein
MSLQVQGQQKPAEQHRELLAFGFVTFVCIQHFLE